MSRTPVLAIDLSCTMRCARSTVHRARSTVHRALSPPRLLMHVSRDRLHVLDRSHRQNAMAKVEDVARPPDSARQHVVGSRENAIERSEKNGRIEIALDRAVAADPFPRLVERRA